MVRFEAIDAVALYAATHYAVYHVTHRSPWGWWTTEQSAWYAKIRRTLGVGYPASMYGVLWILLYPLIGLGEAWYISGYDCGNTGHYAATVVLGIAMLTVDKVWRVLMWDYRDGVTAFWLLLLLQIPLYVAHIVLLALSLVCPAHPEDHWVRWYLVGVVAVALLDAFYHLFVMWEWATHGAVTRRVEGEYPLMRTE